MAYLSRDFVHNADIFDIREFIKNNIPNINKLHTDFPEYCMQERVVLL